MVSTLQASKCLTTIIGIMNVVREIVKVSFLLLILLSQFQTGSYHFLHAIDTNMSNNNTTNIKNYLIRDKVSQFSIYPANVSWTKVATNYFLKNKNSSKYNSVQNAGFWMADEEELGGWEEDEDYDNDKEQGEVSTKMNPEQLQLFEQKLLKLLGMKKRPERDRDREKIMRHNKIPKYLTRLSNNRSHPTSNLNLPGRFVQNANTIRSFYQTGYEDKLEGLHSHMIFDITSIPFNEEITGAELRVPFTTTSLGKNSTIKIQVLVHDIVKIQRGKMEGSNKVARKQPISYPIDSKTLKLKSGESSTNNHIWLTFDVLPAVNRWNLEKYKKNKKLTVGLAIELIVRDEKKLSSKTEKVHNYVRVRRSTKTKTFNLTIPEDSRVAVPMLLTFSDDGHNNNLSKKQGPNSKTLSRRYRSHQNQKRRKNHRIKNRRRNLCSRKKMFVDFTDVGWNDWIVAPYGYQAFFCSGSCPFPMAEHLNATNHAVIQALVNSVNPALVPPPCCVPTKYSSLSLLYADSSDRIVLKNYKEMIVDSCGCS